MSNLSNDEIASIIIVFSGILFLLNINRIKLPCQVKKLFNNPIFKMVFLSLLLVYNFNRSPGISLTIALIFVLTLDYLNTEKMYENCEYLKSYVEQNKK
jgi:hypothetical protein